MPLWMNCREGVVPATCPFGFWAFVRATGFLWSPSRSCSPEYIKRRYERAANASDRSHALAGVVTMRLPLLLPAAEVHAAEDNGRPDQLVYPEALTQEKHAAKDAGEGDEVLVDEHPVRPDAAYAPLPG